jgi:KUP system potassium uptake protein
VLHTSAIEGQIYVPFVNWSLCIGVVALTLVFRSSAKLGDIYGVAVTGTFILNTVLFVAVARSMWGTSRLRLALLAGVFLCVEIALFSANVAKVEHGAYLSLVIGAILSVVMLNWHRCQAIVTRNRVAQEGPLDEFLNELCRFDPPLIRVPGLAVFLTRSRATTPLALRAEVEHAHSLHEKLITVSVESVGVPHVEPSERFSVQIIGQRTFKVPHVTIHAGYQDRLNIPDALHLCRKQGLLPRNLDLEHASYFISRIAITPTDAPVTKRWRKQLFVLMARNAASAIDHFELPPDRTVLISSQVPL